MENAADALRIGAWVLIFVMALSVCINAFGQAKTSMDAILTYNDREYYTSYIEENAYKDSSGNLITQRTVGYQDIVPTIYRAYKDNFRITFDSSTGITNVFRKYNTATGGYESVNYIDLEDEKISDIKVKKNNSGDEDITLKEYFIRRIIRGDDGKFGDNRDSWCETQLGVEFDGSGLYNKINTTGAIFKESVGVYYQEERDTGYSEVPKSNRTEKRVITYTKI